MNTAGHPGKMQRMLGATVMAPWWVRVIIAVALMAAVLTVMAAILTPLIARSKRLLRGTVIVVSVGLFVLGSTLCAVGVVLWFMLPGGNAVDLGGIGNWSFRLVSVGLEVSHNSRVLGVSHLIGDGIAVMFPLALNLVATIARRRWQVTPEKSPRPA